MNDFIDNFARELDRRMICSVDRMLGCKESEIIELENYFQVKLPTLYRAFLKKMGRGADKFMLGTDFFYVHLFENREAIEDVLKEEDYPFTLNQSMFVFLSHQGYTFCFFDTSEDPDDPLVYGYTESELKLTKPDQKFSDFLLGTL